MIVCKKKRCIWRVDCGEGKSYCFKASNCPYTPKLNDKLPRVKWAGLVKKMPEYKDYKYDASKRNKKGNSE